MDDASFTVRFTDVQALRDECENNLKHGRAFVAGVRGVEALTPCDIVLVHPDSEEELILGGEIVMVRDDETLCGVGVQLYAVDMQELERFVEGPSREPQASGRPLNRHEQLRAMAFPEQVKLARQGDLNDRVALERLIGKPVWEALLGNSRITVAEVARIAKKGTVPRPLIEQIVDNAGWLQNALVRRALLSNPKLTSESILKVLRQTPRPELKLVEKQTAYPTAVRDAAHRMLGGA